MLAKAWQLINKSFVDIPPARGVCFKIYDFLPVNNYLYNF